ncbi:MAG: InlB B-repeat-containing protein, partial [Clostridia bacterium]|nr:InlB B-repeat-containing protein [Clostridia bacterium]
TVEQSTVDIGSTVTLPTPTKDGYNFAGWYYTYNSIEVEFTENIPVVADITLTAKWSKSYDLYLYYQNAAIVKTGYFEFEFDYDGYITDGYITIEKNNTVYTEDEALEAGWLSNSYVDVNSDELYGYLYFDVSGDYTIHAYANGDTASTCVTVTGESTSTSATFTGSTVSVDSITYLGSTYTSGSEVSLYSAYDYVYVYFNAPEYCEARVTYTDGTKTYVYSAGTGYSDGKYYVRIYESRLYEDYTYTVKLTSADYGSATATFTVKEATITENTVLVQPADIDTYTYYYFDEYYYIAGSDIESISYTLTDTEGNEVTSYDGSFSCNANEYSSGVWCINYCGCFFSECNYKLTVTPYDSENTAITALTKTINITVSEYGSSSSVYWSENDKAEGYDEDYSNTFFTDTSSTYYYVASGELAKVVLNGTNIPVGGSATLTISGISATAACSVTSGKTYLTVTLAALSDDSAFGYSDEIYLYMVGTTADGGSATNSEYIYVYSSAMIDYLDTMVNSYKYSLEKYFADYITEGKDFNAVYTALSSYTSSGKSYKEAYEAAYDINFDLLGGYEKDADETYVYVDGAMDNFTGTVYSSSVDYVGTWLTALDAKTSLCDYALEMYAYYNGCYYLVLDGYSVYDDDDLFWLGVSEYLLIQTSDKDICDFLYNCYIKEAELYADELGDIYTNLVKAHDSGTIDEYTAAINALMLSM